MSKLQVDNIYYYVKNKTGLQILLRIDEKMESYTGFNHGISSFLRTIGKKTPVTEIAMMDLKKATITSWPEKR